MGLVAIGITGHMDMNSTFKIAFGDSTLIQLVCVLIFVSYLEQVGLNQIIARWFMSREFVEGKPWLLTLMAMLSAAVLSLISIATSPMRLGQIIPQVHQPHNRPMKIPSAFIPNVVTEENVGKTTKELHFLKQ